MSSDQTTSLSELLSEDDQLSQSEQQMQRQRQMQAQQQQQQQQQHQQQMPRDVQQTEIKEIVESVESVAPVKKKEIFGFVKDIDYKSAILVFAILLLLTSSIYTGCTRSYLSGAVGPDGKTTVIGSLIAAFIGAFVFLFIKFVGKF